MNASPTKKLAYLDGLRGLAVLAVILFHHRLESESFPVRSGLYSLLSPSRFGHVGVHLFLVLSGFCLTHSLIGRARKGRSPSLGRYLRDRWWRIAPPYYAAMAVYLAFTFLQRHYGMEPFNPGAIDARQIVAHLTFLHGLREDTVSAINPPFWSLSLEFQFYLTLPILFALAERIGYRAVVAGVVGASLLYRTGVGYALPDQTALFGKFFLGRWAEFALGMAVASWANRRDQGPSWLGPKAAPWVFLGSLAVVGLGVGLEFRGGFVLVDPLVGLGFALLLTSAILSAESRRGPGRLLAWRPLAALGTISYSVYLTHSLAQACIDRPYARYVGVHAGLVTDTLLLIGSLGFILALGWLFHGAVESHFMRSVDANSAATATPRLSAADPAATVAPLYG
jgi:peptidoglycan/LPS O-acetylase OafA/YrhL